jgi:hypothetical protein
MLIELFYANDHFLAYVADLPCFSAFILLIFSCGVESFSSYLVKSFTLLKISVLLTIFLLELFAIKFD